MIVVVEEYLVLGVHQVVARAHVGEGLLRAEALAQLLHVVGGGHEVNHQRVPLSGDAVRLLVSGAFHGARGCTRDSACVGTWASRVVPLVAGEAVRALALEPAPVRVHSDGLGLVGAPTVVAVADGEGRVGFVNDGAGLSPGVGCEKKMKGDDPKIYF